jgi:hypothetical protein
MKKVLLYSLLLTTISAFAQEDSIRTKRLDELVIRDSRFSPGNVSRLPGVQGKLNVNNVTDKQYFTKRPSFYPGPGVWSSDGRSWSASVSFKL